MEIISNSYLSLLITTVRVPSNVRSEQVLQALRRQKLDPREECLTKLKIGEIFGKEVKNVENIFF